VTPAPTPAAATSLDRSGDVEVAAVATNKRRALTIAATPGVVLGVIVGVVLSVVGLPVVGVVALVVVAVGISLWIWHAAPGAVLRSLGAVPSQEWDHPRLHNLVDGLCATMGLPRPAICLVDSPVPNAMALGRDPQRATLVVTAGLDQFLSLVELEGVLAHELVHVKRNDTMLAGVAVVATAPLALLMGPDRATARVHRLIGRGREFSADQRAAVVVRYPHGIGSALDAMIDGSDHTTQWLPGRGRMAALTRWLWIDPMVGTPPGESYEGNLDDTRVRAEALSLY
jgi:Zn-dependent protease with chaperone function